MPEYKCECCNFKTHIKSQFETHNATKKHLKNMNINTEPTSPKSDKSEIQELREIVENHEQTITNMAAEIAALKSSLQECKELILGNIKNSSTYEAPPPPEPKKEGETCNPAYMVKKLNEDPDTQDILDIDTFFLMGNEQLTFDFDDIDNLKDVGKNYAIDKITEFVKQNRKILPFRYQKSSWYVKKKTGWEKEVVPSNKNCEAGSENYNFSDIVRLFIGIFQKRFFNYFEAKLGNAFMEHPEFDRIYAEVLSRENYRNGDILKKIGHLC